MAAKAEDGATPGSDGDMVWGEGLRQVGRKTVAYRSGMGEGGARQRREALPLGQRVGFEADEHDGDFAPSEAQHHPGR